MSIRPSYRRRSVVQVLADGMNAHPPTGRSCCEEAQLTANELARRNEELADAEREIAMQAKNLKWWRHQYERSHDERRKVEAERDEAQESVSRANEFAATCQRERDEWESNADELQAKLDAAEGWPEWMGPAPTREELGEIEVTKSSRGYWVQGVRVAEPETKPEELRLSNIVNDSISSCMRREAVARFIEREQAETDDEDQRVDLLARKLHSIMSSTSSNYLSYDEMAEYEREAVRAVIRTGWTPPESEDE